MKKETTMEELENLENDDFEEEMEEEIEMMEEKPGFFKRIGNGIQKFRESKGYKIARGVFAGIGVTAVALTGVAVASSKKKNPELPEIEEDPADILESTASEIPDIEVGTF